MISCQLRRASLGAVFVKSPAIEAGRSAAAQGPGCVRGAEAGGGGDSHGLQIEGGSEDTHLFTPICLAALDSGRPRTQREREEGAGAGDESEDDLEKDRH